jgi:hypothetical protein
MKGETVRISWERMGGEGRSRPFIDKMESFVLFFPSLLPSLVFIHALDNR